MPNPSPDPSGVGAVNSVARATGKPGGGPSPGSWMESHELTKRQRIVLIVIVGGALIWMAIGLRSCIFSMVNPRPWKVGEVVIPDKQMTISLWAGSMQEAFIQPYDGAYRN